MAHIRSQSTPSLASHWTPNGNQLLGRYHIIHQKKAQMTKGIWDTKKARKKDEEEKRREWVG
jgi:hypothetical protein